MMASDSEEVTDMAGKSRKRARRMRVPNNLRNIRQLTISKPSLNDYVNRGSAAVSDIAGNTLHKAQGAGRAALVSQLEGRSELVALVHVLEIVCDNVSYADLSYAMQAKLKSAGLGGIRGIRTSAGAESFFDTTVPNTAKLFGETGVGKFLSDKDASHIKSFQNRPDLVNADSNFVWEAASANRARGGADMTWSEHMRINLDNGFDSFAIAAGQIVPRAVLYATVIEAAISILENSIYVYRGHKDISTALQDTSVNVVRSAVIGLVSGVLLSGAIALGAGPFIAAVAPALGIIGAALLIYTVGKRLHTALTASNPALSAQDLRKHIEDMPDPSPVEVPADRISELVELRARVYDELDKRGIFANALEGTVKGRS